MKTEEILSLTNNGLDVFQHYVGHLEARGPLKLNHHYPSPLGHEGRASFDLYEHQDVGRICFKDHGLEHKGGDCFAFVQRLFNVEFSQALDLICEDVLGMARGEHRTRLNMPRPERVVYTPLPRMTDVPHVTLTPQLRAWTQQDADFFNRNLTTLGTVERYHGRAIQYYDLRKPEKQTRIYESPNDPVYGYNFPATSHWKIYRPYSERFKWITNLDARKDIFGLHLLPDECPVILLAAGNRDTMSLHELTGLPVLALASESAKMTSELGLLLRSIATKGVYSVMDTDAAGVKATDYLLADFGIRPAGQYLHKLHPRNHIDGSCFNDHSQAIEYFRKAGEQTSVAQVRSQLLALAA